MSDYHSRQPHKRTQPNKASVPSITSHQTIPALVNLQTPDAILHLQRTLGNRAVQQMIMRSSATATDKKEKIGLEKSKLTNTFVNRGYAYWKAQRNKDQDVIDYASFLVDIANKQLESIGVPPAKHDFRTSGSVGAFRKFQWKIYFNTNRLGNEAITIGDLSQEDAAEIANTVYHEIRHAEQSFRVSRLLAGEGMSAEDIAEEMPIPAEIAQKAVMDPLENTPDNAKEYEEAREWRDITVGTHRKYKQHIVEFDTMAYEIKEAVSNATDTSFTETKQKVSDFMKHLEEVEMQFIIDERERVSDIENPTEQDQNILGHLEDIDQKILDIFIQWDDGNNATDLIRLKAIEPPIDRLWLALFNAYEDFAHEKDAWEVGDKVEDKFKNK